MKISSSISLIQPLVYSELANNVILFPSPSLSQVVIKYVPYVADSKRAMDEYTSEIFMGGHNTIVLHNTCEDSLLAAPLIIDLVIIAELCERIQVRNNIIICSWIAY